MGFKNLEASAEVPNPAGADSKSYDVNLSDRDSVRQTFPSSDANSKLPEQRSDAASNPLDLNKQSNVLDFNVFPQNLDINGKAWDAAKLYGGAQYLDFSGLKFLGLPDIDGYNGSKPNDGSRLIDGSKAVDRLVNAAEQFPPKVAIVDGAKVVADDKADVQPKDAKPQTLSDKVLEAAKVGKLEGYYQVADRVLGPGFSHAERMELVGGMRTAFKATPDGQKRDDLWRGDKLLTKENMDSVLNSIKDEGLRNRIKERLLNPESMPEPKKQPTREERQQEVPDKQPKDRKQPQRDRPQEQPELRPRNDTPEGQKKSAYLKRYNEGDTFSGSTSTYWQGRNTASGIPFNYNEMTAASREFPFGTVLKVTNPANGKEVRVVVTDHGPFAGKKVERPDGSGERVHGRVLDISLGAANHLGMGKTVKNLDIKVEHIPEQGKWGKDRRNIHKDYREDVVATIRRLNSQRGRYTA